MDIRTLKLFLHLAEALHFGRASEAAHISPSALSRSIKQLEEELGVVLFERDNRKVRLTHAGQAFGGYAREAVDGWEAMRTRLQSASGELSGEISLFCSVTASYSFLYELLSRFRLKYPKIEIKLHTGDAAAALGRVLSGEEDITIAARPDRLAPQLAFKRICISPLVFIAPLADPGIEHLIETAAWRELPMILSEEGLARQRVDGWFRRKGIKPKIYAQVAGNEAIVSMVGLGFGVGVVPKIVLDNSPLADRVRILSVAPSLEPFEVGLCALQKRLTNPLVGALWQQLEAMPPTQR